MCCYSKLCKDGSNSVCVAIVNSARMEVTVYVLLCKLCKDGSNSVCVASKLCKDGSNSVCVASKLCKDGSNSVCVAIVNSARMEVTVYVLL